MSSRLSYGFALLLLVLAVGLRTPQLADLPPGLTVGEQQTIRLIETARRGAITILFEEAPGRGVEMLGPTVLAVTTVFTGSGPFALRWTFVLIALVTLALVYTLGVRLFGPLAGLAALALLALTFAPTLLARSVLIDALVPLLVVTVMLALARALPVYRIARAETANTTAFATLGAALGLSIYLHPVGLLLVAPALMVVAYMLLSRSLEHQRLGYVAFSLLIALILAIPYVVFSINRPDLSAFQRFVGSNGDVMSNLLNSVLGLLWRGSLDPSHSVPARPLFDPFTALLTISGVGATLRFRRYNRYVLVLVFLIGLAPAAMLASAVPRDGALAAWWVPLALAFGAAAHLLLTRAPQRARLPIAGGLVLLGGFHTLWTGHNVFTTWPQLPSVRQAYEADLHQLARFLDREMGTLPTVICYPQVGSGASGRALNATQRLILMTNRRPLDDVRFVDCNTGLVFPRGGESFYVLLVEPDALQTAPPYIQDWLALGMPRNDPTLPTGRVLHMVVGQALADRLGAFTTTVAARYGEMPQLSPPVNPPIRFGGNITWLGTEPDPLRRYRAGELMLVITYWRIESGVVPPDLQFFTHVLSDPVTLADNRDMISVDVSYLRPRDVVLQYVPILLRETLLSGTYLVSIGAYQEQTAARLPVFDANQQRQGDRLILYSVEISE